MAKKESLSFEDALERLETIIEDIDDEQPLEDAINLYEEGITLANHCTEKLEKAELRIEKINSGENDE